MKKSEYQSNFKKREYQSNIVLTMPETNIKYCVLIYQMQL